MIKMMNDMLGAPPAVLVNVLPGPRAAPSGLCSPPAALRKAFHASGWRYYGTPIPAQEMPDSGDNPGIMKRAG